MLTSRTLAGTMSAAANPVRPLGALSDLAVGLSTVPTVNTYTAFRSLCDTTETALNKVDLGAMPVGQRMTAALDIRLVIAHMRTHGEAANVGTNNLLEDRLVDCLREIDPLANAPDHDPALLSQEDISVGNPARDPRPISVVIPNITTLPTARMDLLGSVGLEAMLTPGVLKAKA